MSVINHQYKHIFIHIPKTAGHSMQTRDWVGNECHTTLLEYMNDRRSYRDKYFKWAFVRNPYDRMVSCYHWAKENWNKKYRYKFWVTDDDLKTFTSYCEWVKMTGGHLNDNKPQYQFIIDKNDSIAIDFIGRYENLIEDWNVVCMKVVGHLDPLPHMNKTKRKPWKCYYDDYTASIVYDLYYEDFKRFGYSGNL